MDDHMIECGRCGERIYDGLTRCPHCGVNLYEPEDDEGLEDDRYRSWKDVWLFRPMAFAYGWAAAGVLVFTLHMVLRQFLVPGSLTIAGWVFVTTAELLGVFAGGYLAGALSEKKFGFQLSMYILVTIFSLLLLEGYWQELSIASFTQPVLIFRWCVILADGAVGYLLATKGRFPAKQSGITIEEGEDLFWDLLLKVRFDAKAAERLIDDERKRAPDAARAALIRAAIERWERDNR